MNTSTVSLVMNAGARMLAAMQNSAAHEVSRHVFVLLTVVSGAVSCGQTTGSAGTGGASGSGAGSGNSDDAGSPPAQGGTRFAITPDISDPMRICTRAANGYSAAIPEDNTISNVDPGQRVVDGIQGANVKCSVSSQGAWFTFHGSLVHGPISLEIEGKVDTQTGTATVSTNTPQTLYLSNLDESPSSPCAVQVNQEKVGEGYIFASWSCPKLADRAEPSLLCRGDGVIVFENCSN